MRALIAVTVVIGFCLVVALFSLLQDLQIRIRLPLRQPFDEGDGSYENHHAALPAKGRAG